jgi:hypothetical protein
MRLGASLLIACAAAGSLSTARAAPVNLTLDGAWFEFAVGGVGDVWRSPLDGLPLTFSVSSATAFTLRVVDVGFAGDQLEVVSDGTSVLGSTSTVLADDSVFAFAPDDAFAAPGTWSQGVWLLGPGTYTFNGAATASPFGGGAWAISALAGGPSAAIPEPRTWGLVLGALAIAGATARRRRTDQR